MSSKTRVLYVGVTSNIEKRVLQHKNETFSGFSKKYNCKKLVYVEEFSDINEAIPREKQIKKWSRNKKINLIENINPKWLDLTEN